MKITRVRPWIVNGPQEQVDGQVADRSAHMAKYVFVQVETDEGLTGWGEITSYPGLIANRTVAAAIRTLDDLLRGEDPTQIEYLWNKVFRAYTYLGSKGAVTAMISAVDIACWDITAQSLGVPIYEMLGGKIRDNVQLYTHFQYDMTVERMVENALAEVGRGSTAIKTDPFIAAGGEMMLIRHTAYTNGQIERELENRGVAMIEGIRKAVGPDIQVLIDAHSMFNVPTAVRLANRLAEFDITWFEEPCPPESYDALESVRNQVKAPICVGERLYTRYEFLPVLNRHLTDYIMPDVTWTGGISELKKIATLAEAFYIPISPHDASGPVNIMAGAHVSISTPNFYRQEARRIDMSFYNAFLQEPLQVVGDCLIMPDRPGLGAVIDVDYLKAHEVDG